MLEVDDSPGNLVPTQLLGEELVQTEAVEGEFVSAEAVDLSAAPPALPTSTALGGDEVIVGELIDGETFGLNPREQAARAPRTVRKRFDVVDQDQVILMPQGGAPRLLAYDLLDPQSRKSLGSAREGIGPDARIASLLASRPYATTCVVLRDHKERELGTIVRPPHQFKARVEIYDPRQNLLGFFDNSLFAVAGGFWIYDGKEQPFAELRGQWKPTPEFQFHDYRGRRLGSFTWDSLGTGRKSVDCSSRGISWEVSFGKALHGDRASRLLVLASALAFDLLRLGSV
jgi:hypothetical protein